MADRLDLHADGAAELRPQVVDVQVDAPDAVRPRVAEHLLDEVLATVFRLVCGDWQCSALPIATN